MKNFKTFLACAGMLALALVMIISCGKENPVQPTEKQQIKATDLGKIHNEGLDYLLKAYADQGVEALKQGGLAEILPFTADKTVAFLIQEKGFSGDPVWMRTQAMEAMNRLRKPDAIQLRNDDETFAIIASSGFSNEAQALLVSSITVFDDPTLDYAGVIAALNAISQAASNLQSNVEVEVVQGAISVGISSSDYWRNGGIEEWASTWGITNPGEVIGQINWTDVGKADTAGAVAGAITGALGGPIGSAVGAGIGAIAASAAELTIQLLYD